MDKETLEAAVLLLAPFAPHMGEELWEELGHTDSVFHHEWPAHDEEAMKDDEVEIPVQVNGKTKAVISIPVDISKEDAIAKAKVVLGEQTFRKHYQRDLCSEEDCKHRSKIKHLHSCFYSIDFGYEK